MTEENSNTSNESGEQGDQHTTTDEGTTAASSKKKTTRRSSKKTTKKAAQKKTAKKTAKKAAKKKTTKKTTRKKTTKKSSSTDDTGVDEAQSDEQTETDTDTRMDDGLDDGADDQSEDQIQDARDDDTDDSDEDDKDGSRRSGRKRSSKRGKKSSKQGQSSKSEDKPRIQMIVNYVPGEECRIAMVEDGKLEEFMVEPTDQVSRVGNIYVGRVANIEPAIQAAFIDFGTEENGFLHVSDLHPQYFAQGDEKTEQVGKKTPRRSRPPIQDCLKRGQEIIVQVLKEGVGTKGPTLTSYLSIPGRFLVMMPGMDKVGVSRKEEDDDKRKAAKQILSQLELPEGFGFILRTAGFDRTKAELKRDLAYLARLWKDMETRRKKGKKPRLLYTESDLLVRSIRDLLTSEVDRVVIDSEPALKRVARFIKIAAPRSGAKLSHYTGELPIFHAFGLESQINEIHAREVMLPSGGRLVIDQTEALVAIDVNSGRSRAARDAETNAYQTNVEAVDAICRQLRLRDMGGLVVCDMIDMRFSSHRKQIEQRFNERLKRDRAKSTTAPISPFGLLEMTRQRMRGSMESQHFVECPICHGRGLVKKPDSVAATAIRDLAALLTHEKVHRAELVVHARVAGALLSTKRASLTRIELISGKALDVRVSDSLPIDRVAFYAYDASGADIAIEKLKSPKGPDPEPSIVEWRDQSSPDGSWAMDPLDEVDETTVHKLAEEIARKAEQAEHAQLPVEGELDENDRIDDAPKKKRRRRRGGRGRASDEQGESNAEETKSKPDSDSAQEAEPESDDTRRDQQGDQTDDDGQPKKKRRRRRRGGRGRNKGEQNENQDASGEDEQGREQSKEQSKGQSKEQDKEQGQSGSEPDPSPESRDERESDDGEASRSRRRPRRRPTPPRKGEGEQIAEPKPRAKSDADAESKPKKATKPEHKPKPGAESNGKPAASETKRRGLYSNARRTLSASELAKLGIE